MSYTWLTVKEAAIEMGLRQKMVYDLIDAGKLTCFKPSPRNIRIDIKEIENFIKRNTINSK